MQHQERFSYVQDISLGSQNELVLQYLAPLVASLAVLVVL